MSSEINTCEFAKQNVYQSNKFSFYNLVGNMPEFNSNNQNQLVFTAKNETNLHFNMFKAKTCNDKLNSNFANFVSEHNQFTDKNKFEKSSSYSLVWTKINYKIRNSAFNFNFKNPFSCFKNVKKHILNDISGHLNTGELVALIGPSGVGKSSLLEILAGRREKNITGDVFIKLQQYQKRNILNSNNKLINETNNNWDKIAFIPQTDNHLEWLTVFETLLYASKIKNCKLAQHVFELNKKKQSTDCSLNQDQKFNFIKSENEYHKTIVLNIIIDLSLDNCMHNLVRNCSGGQLRRLSIGLELLHQPRLILIDEPTTGLDFSSAYKCIQTLRSLTMMKKPQGIIASIHQPSSLVLQQFHRVYTLAKGGQCIYDGTVSNLVSYFNSFQIKCPLYFNPADFSIQIANGDFGPELISKLADHQLRLNELKLKQNNSSNFFYLHKQEMKKKLLLDQSKKFDFKFNSYQIINYKFNVKNLMKNLNSKSHPTIAHTFLLLQRSWKCTLREPTLTWLRLFQFIFTAFLISNLHNYNVGELNGCFSDLTSNLTHSKLDTNLFISNSEQFVHQIAKIKDNSIILFFTLMFLVMSSIIPTLLTFPNEMKVFIKEKSNGWYSCLSYYMAKIFCDIPFVILCPFLFCLVFYPLTGQIMIWWRFVLFYLISLLLCLIAQSLGFIVGSIFIDDKLSAIFIGSVQSFPILMIGGYLIRKSVMNWLVKPVWYISYIRYSFSAIIISIYGFGRCLHSPLLELNYLTKEQKSKTLLAQVREMLNEDDFNCLYDSYFTDSGYELDNLFKNCNLTLPSLFTRTLNNNTIELNSRIYEEAVQYDNSFVLSYYEITNDSFHWNIISLLITLVFLKVLNYIIILQNSKRHSKH